MPTVSIVISAFNEEEGIKDCLESVKDLADEIVFVDNESGDKTVDIAKKYMSKIFSRSNNPMLNVNKNFGFTKATGDWILSLDADERVTAELSKEIKEVLNGKWKMENGKFHVDGYWIPRKNIIFGKWIQHSIWWPDYQLRLFKRGKGKFPEKHVHEYIQVEGETAKLQMPIVHENYKTVSQWIQKMDKIYTDNEVVNRLAAGEKVVWTDAISFPSQDFLKTFFLQKGYKDGLHGLVLSLMQAFYAEIVFAKMWELQRFEDKESKHFLSDIYKTFIGSAREFQYWFFTSVLDETRNPLKKIVYRLLRKRAQRKLNL
ncbi:MAG: glycosyltransferase family 2 protein [Candidatus Levybacteria bacterium]|nr:glycosyltransferase family 2 protein [Candidatus Levybacteria bacterium]